MISRRRFRRFAPERAVATPERVKSRQRLIPARAPSHPCVPVTTTYASLRGQAIPSERRTPTESSHPRGARGVSLRPRVSAGTTQRRSGSPRYILIADRDADLVESLRDFVLNACDLPKVEIRTASSARDALELVRENHFDIILSDYDLHPNDAQEFRSFARARVPGVRLVFFTSLGSRRDISGFDGRDTVVLPKPLDPHALQDLLLSVVVGAPTRSLPVDPRLSARGLTPQLPKA